MMQLVNAHRVFLTCFLSAFFTSSLCLSPISRTLFLLFCGILTIVYSMHILYEHYVFRIPSIMMFLFLVCSVWRLYTACRTQIFSVSSQAPPVTRGLNNMAISHCPAFCSSLHSVKTSLVLPDCPISQSQEPPHTHSSTRLCALVISFITTSCPDKPDQNFTAESIGSVEIIWCDWSFTIKLIKVKFYQQFTF